MAKTTTTQTAAKTTARNPEINHAVQHFEIVTKDPVNLRKFLEKQFGWKFETTKMPGMTGDYHTFRTPDGNGGGVLAPQMPTAPLAVTPYVNVENCSASEKSCQKNGATIVMPTTDIPGVGRFFMFQFQNSPVLACFESTNIPSRN